MCGKWKERVLMTLRQIEESILLLQDWNKEIRSADDYLLSPEGTKVLAATCMLIEAIGEAYKRIDEKTEGTLLPEYEGIPWKAVKGIRDRIAHGYFEIDAEIIYEAVTRDVPELLVAARFFIQKLSE